MRHTLRRILWIVPTLVAVSMVLFWFLLRVVGWQADGHEHSLPLFFNPSPQSITELVAQDVNSIATDAPERERAEARLVRLGGAALPHVLPELDAHPTAVRQRLALALNPIADRMGVGRSDDRDTPEKALSFWTRFWRDRHVDFRGPVARRAVIRLARHSSSSRREDLRQLDTFALNEIMSHMGHAKQTTDLLRIQNLSQAAANVTGLPWRLNDRRSLSDGQRIVRNWQAWWLTHRSDYVSFAGTAHLSAMFTETEYGRWAQATLAYGVVTIEGDTPLLDSLSARAVASLRLLTVALAIGYLLALALLLWTFKLPPSLRAPLLAVSLAAILALALVSLPARLIASLVLGELIALKLWFGQRELLCRESQRPEVPAAQATGASPLALRARELRACPGPLLATLPLELPWMLSLGMVLEVALGLDGLGMPSLRALEEQSVAWFMLLGIFCTLLVATGQILSDTLLRFHPQLRQTLAKPRGRIG